MVFDKNSQFSRKINLEKTHLSYLTPCILLGALFGAGKLTPSKEPALAEVLLLTMGSLKKLRFWYAKFHCIFLITGKKFPTNLHTRYHDNLLREVTFLNFPQGLSSKPCQNVFKFSFSDFPCFPSIFPGCLTALKFFIAKFHSVPFENPFQG